MKTQFNEETHKHEWILDRLYQKAIYTFGFVYTVCLVLAFLVGFIGEINK